MARILIVDDDAAMRDALAAAVADLGHVPLEAGDGSEALTMIRSGSAEAVILDLRMASRLCAACKALIRLRSPF
jgi:CheY-like chemotaxis protein